MLLFVCVFVKENWSSLVFFSKKSLYTKGKYSNSSIVDQNYNSRFWTVNRWILRTYYGGEFDHFIFNIERSCVQSFCRGIIKTKFGAVKSISGNLEKKADIPLADY